MRKDMAHFLQTQRPVSEGQRPPLSLQALDAHSPPGADSWNFIFCAPHSRPQHLQTHLFYWVQGKPVLNAPFTPHSHPSPDSFYIPRYTCFLP